MRRFLQVVTFISGFFLFLCAGCQHDPGKNVTPTNSTGNNNNNLAVPAAGNWKVSLFMDHGTDMTAHLDGYSFSFNSDGTMTVNTGVSTVSGTWQTFLDNSQPKFLIALVTDDEMLEEMSEDWSIGVITDTEINLSRSGSHSHILNFAKL